jgi:hypothetical protein
MSNQLTIWETLKKTAEEPLSLLSEILEVLGLATPAASKDLVVGKRKDVAAALVAERDVDVARASRHLKCKQNPSFLPSFLPSTSSSAAATHVLPRLGHERRHDIVLDAHALSYELEEGGVVRHALDVRVREGGLEHARARLGVCAVVNNRPRKSIHTVSTYLGQRRLTSRSKRLEVDKALLLHRLGRLGVLEVLSVS